MSKNPETLLTDKIKSWLKKQPDIFFFKVHGSQFGKAGIPDLVGNVGTRAFYIEVKVAPNKPTKLQAHRICQIIHSGAAAIVAYSVEDVQALVGALRDMDPDLCIAKGTDRQGF